jgi:hypothetical protein
MASGAFASSAISLALACAILSTGVFANDDNCQSEEVVDVQSKGPSLLQARGTRSKALKGPFEGLKKTLSWTTNIGQEHHDCQDSRFEAGFNGTISGVAVFNAMLLKKGACSLIPNSTKPVFTRELSCEPEATGCHMWCAPVWHADFDTKDWTAFGARCSNWDGTFDQADSACAKTGRLFTWSRVDVPGAKNVLDMTFAIPRDPTTWGSPFWVTIYDPLNWAKSYRWCFNQQGDYGSCDSVEYVPLSQWHDRSFKFSSFMSKHGFAANDYVLELAVYSESESLEVVINNLHLRHVEEPEGPAEEPPTTTAAPSLFLEEANPSRPCGSEGNCGILHQCCRKANATLEARCCPKNWKCCEDSCCPEYYTCNRANGLHTCNPPERGMTHGSPRVCQI